MCASYVCLTSIPYVHVPEFYLPCMWVGKNVCHTVCEFVPCLTCIPYMYARALLAVYVCREECMPHSMYVGKNVCHTVCEFFPCLTCMYSRISTVLPYMFALDVTISEFLPFYLIFRVPDFLQAPWIPL